MPALRRSSRRLEQKQADEHTGSTRARQTGRQTRVRSARSASAPQNEERRQERDAVADGQEQLTSADDHSDGVKDSSQTLLNDWNAERLGPPWSVLEPVAEGVRRLEAIPGRAHAPQSAEVRQICEVVRLQAKQHDDEPALVGGLRRISSQLAELRDKHRDDQNESKRLQLYLRDVLLHLIPDFVRLLLSIIQRYAVLDCISQATRVRLDDVDQLGFMSGLCADIVALGKDLQEKEKPRRFMNAYKVFVTPTQRNIIKPIRSVMEKFLTVISDTRRREEHDRILKSIREEEAQRRQDVARQEEFHRAHRRKIREWQRLHEQRRYAERGFLSLAKQMLLAYVEPVDEELDANGLPFERVDVFAPLRVRVGPSQEQMRSARAKSWSAQQEQDLLAGLEKYAGDDVLVHVFTRYCGNYLSAFSVSDIVTRAADLKEQCLLENQESQQEAPSWVQQIPVWTRPHALGKENEEHAERQN